MLEIEIVEAAILKRVDVQEIDRSGKMIFWAHIDMRIGGEWITLSSDGEYDNSLYGEFRKSYKGITEEEAIRKFIAYMKEDE